MDVHPEWWKTLFDETYLLTDARSVCDTALTQKEVDFLETALPLSFKSDILDLCGGQGRHALELAGRGYENITVLDYSNALLETGCTEARRLGLGVSFLQGDARQTGLKPESYDFILVMGSSFGYFENEQENQKVLNECHRLLRAGGSVLLDLPDIAFVTENFSPLTSHRVNETIRVERKRILSESLIKSRETVICAEKGVLRVNRYCVRLYDKKTISGMLQEAGFSLHSFTDEFMRRRGEYGSMTCRLVVVGVK